MGKRWDAIIKRCSGARIGVEVGVLKGELSSVLLERLSKLKLFMVDVWKPFDDGSGQIRTRPKRYARAFGSSRFMDQCFSDAQVVASKYYPRAIIVKKTSLQAAQQFKTKSLDFVFLDAAHDYESVKADIKTWLPKVKVGGWLCGHDYGKICQGVPLAVHELLDDIELDYGMTWFYRKPKHCKPKTIVKVCSDAFGEQYTV